MLRIVIPTVPGREDKLRRALDAYTRTLEGVEHSIDVRRGYSTCGAAWNDGAADAQAAGDEWLHCSADDLVAEPGWFQAAIEACTRGFTPAPVVWTEQADASRKIESSGAWHQHLPDFTPVPISVIPFCPCELWREIPPIHYFCVPTSHRILTRALGWATVDDVAAGDLVMAFDQVTHEMRWEPLMAVNRFPYAGDLLTISRKGDTFQFTPDHRWPVLDNVGRPRGFRAGRDLRVSDRLPIRGEFVGDDSILDPRLAAILGWVVGDGSYHAGRRQMVVYQADHQHEKVAEITALLEREPIPSVIGRDVRTWYVWPADKHAIEEVWRSKRDTPRVAAGLSREAAEAMMTALWRAEGSYTSAGGRVIGQSPTANPDVCEAIQILALMTGSNASVPRGRGKAMFLKSSKALGCDRATRGTVYYEGDVWCPSTPSGTWIVEHAGAAIPTGNSDNAFTSVMQRAGRPAVTRHGYEFLHTWAQPGRVQMGGDQWDSEHKAWLAFHADLQAERAPKEASDA